MCLLLSSSHCWLLDTPSCPPSPAPRNVLYAVLQKGLCTSVWPSSELKAHPCTGKCSSLCKWCRKEDLVPFTAWLARGRPCLWKKEGASKDPNAPVQWGEISFLFERTNDKTKGKKRKSWIKASRKSGKVQWSLNRAEGGSAVQSPETRAGQRNTSSKGDQMEHHMD